MAIARASPAYQADLFERDVVMSVNGTKLNGANDAELFRSIISQKNGQRVHLEIWRNGTFISKDVQLSPD